MSTRWDLTRPTPVRDGPNYGVESIREIADRSGDTPHGRRESYGGVEMRSHLEVAFARYLDRLGEEWVYEPRIYGRRGEGYLPDFQILRHHRPCFIEVKPTIARAEEAMQRMRVIWESHPDALLLIACAEESRFYDCIRGEPWRSWVERWEHS